MGDAGAPDICTRTARFWLDADGILRIIVLPNAEEGLEDAKNNRRVIKEFLVDGKLPPRLLDIRGMKSSTREARQYSTMANRPGENDPMALVIGSGYSKVAANFFIALRRPWMQAHPHIRFFTSESEAKAWLKGFLHG
ncbi:MAG: hypothetical protein HN348_26220 [Proteobacteria bacterium]|jgi:hypothetical protein|nr:hypothetical protein [Pseudomonadota bacterium]